MAEGRWNGGETVVDIMVRRHVAEETASLSRLGGTNVGCRYTYLGPSAERGAHPAHLVKGRIQRLLALDLFRQDARRQEGNDEEWPTTEMGRCPSGWVKGGWSVRARAARACAACGGGKGQADGAGADLWLPSLVLLEQPCSNRLCRLGRLDVGRVEPAEQLRARVRLDHVGRVDADVEA